MMYEKLCRQLRAMAGTWGISLPREAADAIEELQKLLEGVSADNDSLCEKVEELTRRCEQFQYVPEEGET